MIQNIKILLSDGSVCLHEYHGCNHKSKHVREYLKD